MELSPATARVLPGRGGGGAAERLAETDRREGERREEGEGEGAEASSFRAPAYRGLELGDERGLLRRLVGSQLALVTLCPAQCTR